MGLDMFHQNEIARALRMVVSGASLLGAEVSGGFVVTVASNRLFPAGALVRLVDDTGQVEEHVVAEALGVDQVRLEAEVAGTFGPTAKARLQLREGAAARLKWVAQGRPEMMPEPRRAQLPAVVVEPVGMKQPANAGTNRTYQQEYEFDVFYIRKVAEGEEAGVELGAEIADLFNLVMSDPYLEETCWHAQVTEVEMRPREEEELRRKQAGVQVVRMGVLAQRAEVW